MALTTPFAQNGDKKEIPQNSSDGSVNFNNGFGSFYALPPEEGGLFIDRAQFNQLMFDTTSQVLENKQQITAQANRINEVNTTLTQSINTKANQATTYTKTEVNNLVNAKANANATVNLTGNQTIAGIKTFSSPVVVPNATANTHAVNLAQPNTKANQATTYTKAETYTKTEVDDRVNGRATWDYSYPRAETYTKTEVNNLVNAKATVNLTGNQTIAGVKTFSSVPVCATAPTANNHLVNKGYIDSIGQVPDYSAGVSIPANKAFTAQFNGVVEIYCRAGSNYHWAFCLGNTNNNDKTIMSGSTSGSGEVWDAGQAIIIKGETYYFYANAYIYRSMMYPFKSVRSR